MSEKNPERTIIEDMRILMVEDDTDLAHAVASGLELHGFRVTIASSAEAAWHAIWSSRYELILLDVRLLDGEEAGFELAQRMREANVRQPILFLTARESVPDRVKGLQSGDDYLTKPFALPELVARLQSLMRRGETRPRVIKWRGFELTAEARLIRRGTRPVRLTAKEYQILELFMLSPGRVFSREEILERVWGPGFDSPSNMVNVYVKNLRAKIDDAVIETVRGIGYRHVG
jgi:DNA-binding response OmpR family regulator